MPATADLANSPEVLFIGPPGDMDPLAEPLRKAGFNVVSKRPTRTALERSVLEHLWRAILVHSNTPESFLEAFARRQPASPVLFLSLEWPCRPPLSETWFCLRQPKETERFIRDFVVFLNEHPMRQESSFPSWVSQVLPATRAKSSFSKVLQDVEKGARVVVTKHESPRAVIVSYKEYEALQAQTEQALDLMRSRFASLVAEIQTPAFEKGLDALFNSTPEELGQAAVEAARSRD